MAAGELMAAVAAAERERAAGPGEVPLGQWEAVRLQPDLSLPMTSQMPTPPSADVSAPSQVPPVPGHFSSPPPLCFKYLPTIPWNLHAWGCAYARACVRICDSLSSR